MSVIEMRVNMDCSGCENKIRKALMKIEGVNDVDIDMEMQKVTVMGWADQDKILRAIKRTGRNVEMWPYPYNPESNYYQQYYNNSNQRPVVSETRPITYYFSAARTSSKKVVYSYENNQQYNYNVNDQQYNYNDRYYNYNDDHHGYYQSPAYATMVDEQASSVFSDENPHACSIM